MAVKWGAVGAIATVIGLFAWLYKHKHGQLDSRRDREAYMLKKLAERGWQESPVVFEIDDITIEERTGAWYQLKRWVLRPLEGSVLISLKSQYVFADHILESRLIDVVEEETNTSVEHVETITSGGVPMHVFRLYTVEWDEIMPVVQTLANILAAWMEVDDVQYSYVER
ncbi:hypothetical protein [Halobaculum limi]|uniref:hypothetical protein n=1 Tax=Halobaculum limi TaxID=3031916 RepID=UPI002404A767|nr:hypothetical protein [Halobaculum sp. YSMS11]